MAMHKLSKTTKGDYLMLGPFIEGDTEKLIEEIRALPTWSREWSPATRGWRIKAEMALEVQRIIDRHYGIADVRETLDRVIEERDHWRGWARKLWGMAKRTMWREQSMQRCEACERAVRLDGDDYVSDENGVVLCLSCADDMTIEEVA